MSEQLKISLLVLRTQSEKFKGISTYQKEQQIPASPTLINSLDISKDIKVEYIRRRQNLIDLKNTLKEGFYENLRDYQRGDILFLSQLTNKANFNEQRLGKTVETLTTMKELKENNAIIMAPKSVTFQWLSEYEKWHGGAVKLISAKIKKEDRLAIYKSFKGTLIMNYNIVLMDINELIDRKIDTVVLDEGHRIRNHKNMKKKKDLKDNVGPVFVKAIMSLSRKAKSRYILTGTPSPAEPHKIYALLSFLFPNLFKSYWAFIDYYFELNYNQVSRDKKIPIIGGYKSKEKEKELLEFIETISVQRKRIDHMKWINPINKKTVTLYMDKELLSWYNELANTFEIEDKELITQNTLDLMTRQRQLVIDHNILFKSNTVGLRTEFILDYIEDNPNKSILIVSEFTEYLKLLHSQIKGSKILHGGTKEEERINTQDKFNNKEFKILLGNLQVIKEGMKLHGADTLLVSDLAWNPGDNDQMFDRIIPTTEEIAKDKEQEIIILESDAFIDTYLATCRNEKASMSESVNNYQRFVGGSVHAHPQGK